MTDLAHKIADAVNEAIANGSMGSIAYGLMQEAIRTALPVAQGEAVAYRWRLPNEHGATSEMPWSLVEHSQMAEIARLKGCEVQPLYAAPPASRIAELEDALSKKEAARAIAMSSAKHRGERIAELEREVERLREALDSEKLFSSQALDACEEISIDRDRLRKILAVLDALTAQECGLLKVTAENLQCSQSELLCARVEALAAQENNDE